ncbi:MAG: HEPN domain-containing protein [Crocinitomicaceae bacterium]|nr:HEPN domain-containing protein [Crocinitomicaceae bacterium]
MLKPVADVNEVNDEEYLDWGSAEKFKTEIGIGECAGVKIDLAKTLLFEANEKLDEADYFFLNQQYADAAYTVYSSIIQTAKCYLLKLGIETNSKEQIQKEFENHYEKVAAYFIQPTFESLIYEYRNASESAAENSDWIQTGKRFYELINILIDKK